MVTLFHSGMHKNHLNIQILYNKKCVIREILWHLEYVVLAICLWHCRSDGPKNCLNHFKISYLVKYSSWPYPPDLE